jgi:predicted membrane chloride channel (bestrophin family)
MFLGVAVAWGNIVVSKNYLTRQATTLVKFAQTTSDPKVLTALVEKAAELKSQADETRLSSDLSPRAPDVEPPTR